MTNASLTRFACVALVLILSGTSALKSHFVLASQAFADGQAIPKDYSYDGYGCTGKNVSPELHWSGAPEGTKTFALTVFDPDANGGKGWWHWVVSNIAASTRELSQGDPSPGAQAKTDFGAAGYGGPCPPPGDAPHHYVFTLYALDSEIEGTTSNGPALLEAIKGHILAKAVLVGRFGR